MLDKKILDSQAASLGRIMAWADADEEKLWNPNELAALFEHQLAAPLAFDFGSLARPQLRRVQTLCAAARPPINSFADLLHHPNPPVELLELTKELAKICRSPGQSWLPDEIATMLYVLSIAVARTRCHRWITKLNHPGLRCTFDWALSQPWVDAATREILQQGYRAIDGEERGSDV